MRVSSLLKQPDRRYLLKLQQVLTDEYNYDQVKLLKITGASFELSIQVENGAASIRYRPEQHDLIGHLNNRVSDGSLGSPNVSPEIMARTINGIMLELTDPDM